MKLNEPIVNSGFQTKSCRPGAGNPHPLKMWQPPPAAAATAPVTGHLLRGIPLGGSRAGRVALMPVFMSLSPSAPAFLPYRQMIQPMRDREPDQHADREKQ